MLESEVVMKMAGEVLLDAEEALFARRDLPASVGFEVAKPFLGA